MNHVPKDHRGIVVPEYCPRGLKTCEPLSQIVSVSGETFICAGLNDGTERQVVGDCFTLCFKSLTTDERTFNDEQDFMDLQAVIAQALSIEGHRSRD